MPGEHRGKDQRVQRAAAPRHRILHQAELAEVDLAIHPRITVGDPYRRFPPAEPATVDREPVQRAIRHDHAAAGQLAVDVGQLQLRREPVADLLLERDQRLPRLTVALRPIRAHHSDYLADQLIGQLLDTALTPQARRDRRLHISAGGLAIHPGPLRDRAQPKLAAQPLS